MSWNHSSSGSRSHAILLIAVLSATVVSCGDSGSRALDEREAVRDVVNRFVETGKSGAMEEHLALLVAAEYQAAKENSEYKPLIPESAELQYVVGGVVVDGDLASARLSLMEDDWTDSFDVILAREEAGWRVLEEATVGRIAKAMLGDIGNVEDFLDAMSESAEVPPELAPQ